MKSENTKYEICKGSIIALTLSALYIMNKIKVFLNTWRFVLLAIVTTLVISSCTESTSINKKPIVLGDKSSIVTETDSAALKNYVRDISKKEHDEDDIAKMMVQVDSLKTQQELEASIDSLQPIKGFSIAFKDCKVTFDGIAAKEITAQDPLNQRSVSYVVTKGDLAKMKIKIEGLKDISLKERVFTKLKVADGEKEYLLSDLGRKISDWFNLAGVDNIFVSAGDNSFQFNDLTNKKIKIALDKKLRSKKVEEAEIQAWMKKIAKTNNYTDAPCKLYVSTAQFRLYGVTTKGNKTNKLIQFDIVE